MYLLLFLKLSSFEFVWIPSFLMVLVQVDWRIIIWFVAWLCYVQINQTWCKKKSFFPLSLVDDLFHLDYKELKSDVIVFDYSDLFYVFFQSLMFCGRRLRIQLRYTSSIRRERQRQLLQELHQHQQQRVDEPEEGEPVGCLENWNF